MNHLLEIAESWSAAWGENLWRATWQGAVAIAAVWIITHAWRNLSPRIICWAWRIVCIKLLVALCSVPVVAIPVLLPVPAQSLATQQLPETEAPRPSPISIQPLQRAATDPVVEPLPTANPTVGVATIAMACWLVGVIVFVLLTVRQCRFARRLYQASQPSPHERLARLCQAEAARLAVRNVPKIRLGKLNSPMLVGIRRPAILLPENALEQFDESELRLMLAHELAHQKRRDLAWNWLPTIAGWLLFFHPLVWLLKRNWFDCQEAACDELLIQIQTARPAQYGRLLVKLANFWPPCERPNLAAAGVLGNFRSLEKRIVAMSNVKSPSRRRTAVAATALAVVSLVAVVPWRLVAQEPAQQQSKTAESNTKTANAKTKRKPSKENKNPASPNIIIAEHVLLWEGKEVVTWDEVVARLRKLRPAGPFQPNFYFTNAVSIRQEGENWQFWHDRIYALYRELFEPAGVSCTSISPHNGGKFDAIRTAEDLVPDPKLARSGQVLTPDGKPAAGAQVIILPTVVRIDIVLKGTQLRDRFNEDWLPSNDAGEFTIYPREKEYLIVALHKSGFLLQKASAEDDRLLKFEVNLRPWATVAISTRDKGAKQDVKLSAHPLGRSEPWPSFGIYEIEANDRALDVKVPPGAIIVSRSFKTEHGSISMQAETFEIQPGQKRAVTVQQASNADRKRALETTGHLQLIVEPGGKLDINPPEPKSENNNTTVPNNANPDPAVKEHEDRVGVKIRNYHITVVGNAVDEDNKPIQNATVYLVSTGISPSMLLGRATTNWKGRYEFSNVELGIAAQPNNKDFTPQGAIEVFGEAAGHAFAWQEMKYVFLQRNQGPGFVASEKMETTLRFARPSPIAGQFVDVNGKPIAGVKIQVVGCDYVSGIGGTQKHDLSQSFWAIDQAVDQMPKLLQTSSDTEGRFQMDAIPHDAMCRLLISHPDYGERMIFTSTAGPAPMTFDAGHPVEPLPIKMTLQQARTVSVQVRFADSELPVSNLQVIAHQKRATGNVARETSDSNGKLTLKLPPGEYTLTGFPTNEMDYVETSQPLVVGPAPPKQMAVLQMQPACKVVFKAIDVETGRGIPEVGFWYEVDKSPGARAQVRANKSNGAYPRTNQKGEFVNLENPGKRHYGIWPGQLPPGFQVVDPADATTGREIELPAGKTITVEFKLRKK